MNSRHNRRIRRDPRLEVAVIPDVYFVVRVIDQEQISAEAEAFEIG
jgi:hypothetical protein